MRFYPPWRINSHMFSKKSKRNTPPTKMQALAAIPIINGEVEVAPLETGELVISYPVTLRPVLKKAARWLGKSPQITYRKVQLDLMGSSVWTLLDGRSSVGQIAKKFARIHQVHPKEAEVSVTQFLRALGQRGLIGLR